MYLFKTSAGISKQLKQTSDFLLSSASWHLPHIFVSAVGDQVEGGEVAVHRQQVEAEQHHQHLDDHPHQGRAGTQAQDLRTEPVDGHTLCVHFWTGRVSHDETRKEYSPLLNAQGHSSQQNVGNKSHCYMTKSTRYSKAKTTKIFCWGSWCVHTLLLRTWYVKIGRVHILSWWQWSVPVVPNFPVLTRTYTYT